MSQNNPPGGRLPETQFRTSRSSTSHNFPVQNASVSRESTTNSPQRGTVGSRTSSTRSSVADRLPAAQSTYVEASVERDAVPQSDVFVRASTRTSARASFQSSSTDAPIEEKHLLKDIAFALQGIEPGEFFAWDENERGFSMRSGSLLQRKLFAQFAPLAATRRMLKFKLSKHSPSCLQQGLKHALQAQLDQYDAFISSLGSTRELTLQALHVARLKSEDRLNVMLKILHESERAKGGELVTRLQPILHTGNSDLHSFVHEIYREAVQPLLALTIKWLTTGEVSDPDQEFFIEEHRVDPAHEKYWSDKFTLRNEMIPVTFTQRQAEQILGVGKNIHLIRDVLGARQWRMKQDLVSEASAATFDSIGPVIEGALAHTNECVMKVLQGDSVNISLWFSRCRCIYLLSDSNLFQMLINYVDKPLSSPFHPSKQQALIRELQDLVQRALLEQSSILDPSIRPITNYITSSFDYKLATRSTWDAFSITLGIPRPIQHLLTSFVQEQYRSLFHFLFRVMRAEVKRVSSWRQYVMMDRALEKRIRSPHSASHDVVRMRELCLQTTNLFKQVDSFITNLRSYLVNEVLEVAWSKFGDEIESCKSFDEVLSAHSHYLSDLARHCLMDSMYRSAAEPISKLIDLSMEFFYAQETISKMLEKGSMGDPSPSLAHYQKIFDAFHMNVARLLTVLRTEETRYDFLQALGARLNFTHFYHADVNAIATEF